MAETSRQGISKMRLGAASAALALAILLMLGVVTTQSAQAQTFTVLHNFFGSPKDGGGLYAGLVQDAAGNLYGTTEYGGAGPGTLFKVSQAGKESLSFKFTGTRTGTHPYAQLIRDAAGNLYGTTYFGGDLSCGFHGNACGTVFKLSKTGKETVLYKFTGGTTDGCNPQGGLVRDKAGNLYGTTYGCGAAGLGTVFKLDTAGKETVLHNFSGEPTDGANPQFTSLLLDVKGNLYGVTPIGGSVNNCNYGCGTLYKLSRSGTWTVLHNFAGFPTDGCTPYGTPALDKNSNVYGSTFRGGSGSGSVGTVWKVSQNGTESVLHNFPADGSEGCNIYAGVIMDATGNLYGDTSACGTHYGAGTVYELSKAGTLTVLHTFTISDGQTPSGNLIRDAKGDLYGTTYQGGNGGNGTVWKLTP